MILKMRLFERGAMTEDAVHRMVGQSVMLGHSSSPESEHPTVFTSAEIDSDGWVVVGIDVPDAARLTPDGVIGPSSCGPHGLHSPVRIPGAQDHDHE